MTAIGAAAVAGVRGEEGRRISRKERKARKGPEIKIAWSERIPTYSAGAYRQYALAFRPLP